MDVVERPSQRRALHNLRYPILRRAQPRATSSKDRVSNGFLEMKEEMALFFDRLMSFRSNERNCESRGKTTRLRILMNRDHELAAEWSASTGLVGLVEVNKGGDSTCSP